MERLSLLFIPEVKTPKLMKPWGDDLVAAVGTAHDLRVFDYDQPLAPQFKGVDVVVDLGGHAKREMLDAADKCRLWQIMGTGLDAFDMNYWRSKKMPVANTPGQFSASGLAECAIMFMLMLSRQYMTANENLRRGTMYSPIGAELGERKLGLVGFGTSAKELARLALPFHMRILTVDIRDITDAERSEYHLEFAGKADQLDQLIAESDFLSLHLHLTPETRNIIDARRIGLMKPTAFFINVARGALVDEAALAQALVTGKIAGAGLDVFTKEPPDMTSPMFQLPNVVTLPHSSGTTNITSRRRAQAAVENINRVASGLEPLYRVD